jgi:hypothetical protein
MAQKVPPCRSYLNLHPASSSIPASRFYRWAVLLVFRSCFASENFIIPIFKNQIKLPVSFFLLSSTSFLFSGLKIIAYGTSMCKNSNSLARFDRTTRNRLLTAVYNAIGSPERVYKRVFLSVGATFVDTSPLAPDRRIIFRM